MYKYTVFLIVFVVILSACMPQTSEIIPPTSSALSPTQIPISTQIGIPTQIPIPTQTGIPTQTPQIPTLNSTPTQTQAPVTFNIDEYRKFAILKNNFEGLDQYLGDKGVSVISSSFSPDGSAFAISACWGSLWNTGDCETRESGFLIVIDAITGGLIGDIPIGNSWPGKTAFTPDGSKLLFSTDDHKILLWDLKENKLSQTFMDLTSNPSNKYPDVAVAPDGNTFAAVVDNLLYLWEPSGKLLFQTPAYQTTFPGGLTFNNDGTLLALYSNNRSGVDVIDTSNDTLLNKYPLDQIGGFSFSPDGSYLAGYSIKNGTISIWEVDTGAKVTEIIPNLRPRSITFSPFGDLLIVSGLGDLDNVDSYSKIGELYETANWTYLDDLYSFSSEGIIRFSNDGKKMAIFTDYFISIWGEPDAKLLEGFDQLKKFQLALSEGNYEEAAGLFSVDEYLEESLADIGVDINDLPGSFASLCSSRVIYCNPVKELVMMGHDWDNMTFLVQLQDETGGTITSLKGAQIFYLYMKQDENGQSLMIWLAGDY